MEPRIHRPQSQCTLSGRTFQPGDGLVSALVRSPEGLVRRDYDPAAWPGPPEKCIAWWRSSYPRGDAPVRISPADVLLDVVERLADDPQERSLRYLVALELLRRRVLRFVDQPEGEETDGAPLRLACRRRESVYEVPVAPPAPAEAADVESRLVGLLWSGEAA